MICAVAGTFDPFTHGHYHVVERAQKLFGNVLVAVHQSPRAVFNTTERCAMATEALAALPHIQVQPFDGLLSNFLQQQHINVLVRGVRNVNDWQYEQTMAQFNAELATDIETIFIAATPNLAHISASAVRLLAQCGHNCAAYVAPSVAQRLQVRYAQQS
jgi:pantetheine-phosphate adenylyltransferase